MAILEKGCFCCTIKLCVTILGWISLILAIASVIASVFQIQDLNCNPHVHDSCKEQRNTYYAYLVINVVLLFGAICLLVGIYKSMKILLIPYMIILVCWMINAAVNGFILGAAYGFVGNGIGYVVGAIIACLILIYCLICVISHYQNLRDGVEA